MGFGGGKNDYAAMQAQAQAEAEAKAAAKKKKQNEGLMARSRNYGLDSQDLFGNWLTKGKKIAEGDTTLSSGSLLSLEGTLG